MAAHKPRDAQAGSFGRAATEYERGRPPYPAEALDWLLPSAARRVLDLGAGTGKLTRQLLNRGLAVVAVEPSAGMRREMTRALPGVHSLPGSAEDIPLQDAEVDVVLVAQAWHWVDVERAAPEVARVLTPGGRLGLLWNVRDEREDWVDQLGRLMHRGTEREMNSTDPQVGSPFRSIERCDIGWTHRLTRQALLDLVASRSSVIMLAPAQRLAVLSDVRKLLNTHPALARRPDICLPYVTRCSRTELA